MMPTELWQRALRETRSILIGCAIRHRPIFYKVLCDQLNFIMRHDFVGHGVPRFVEYERTFHLMLGALATQEAEAGRPPLTSFVIYDLKRQTDTPYRQTDIGGNFYAICIELGLLQPKDDRLAFLINSMNAARDYWTGVRVALVARRAEVLLEGPDGIDVDSHCTEAR